MVGEGLLKNVSWGRSSESRGSVEKHEDPVMYHLISIDLIWRRCPGGRLADLYG